MSSHDKEVDFPVAFAEDKGFEDDTDCYLEWLQNDTEFPSLTAKNVIDWELLERKEIYRESITLVQEDNNWSKVNDLDMYTYVEIVEKSKTPTKRTLKPVYPSNSTCSRTQKRNCSPDEEDDCLDFTTIYNRHKARSKEALRSGHLRVIHDLRVLDHCYPALLRMGTSRSKEATVYPELFYGCLPHFRTWLNSKGDALKFAKNFYIIKNKGQYIDKTRHMVDYTDFSVLEPSKKRKHISY